MVQFREFVLLSILKKQLCFEGTPPVLILPRGGQSESDMDSELDSDFAIVGSEVVGASGGVASGDAGASAAGAVPSAPSQDAMHTPSQDDMHVEGAPGPEVTDPTSSVGHGAAHGVCPGGVPSCISAGAVGDGMQTEEESGALDGVGTAPALDVTMPFAQDPEVLATPSRSAEPKGDVASSQLSRVLLPANTVAAFCSAAWQNTRQGHETLGFLLGERLPTDEFMVTHILVPPQQVSEASCTPDTYLDTDYGRLLKLGWIHVRAGGVHFPHLLVII